MGLLKSLLGKHGPAGAEAGTFAVLDDLDPLPSPYASAEAAIDAAVRARSASTPLRAPLQDNRRDLSVSDRRSPGGNLGESPFPDRRSGPSDRRIAPQGFGKRGLPK